ncbi:hypothetical protein Q5752_002031 [Cryptotrichosporon argae]
MATSLPPDVRARIDDMITSLGALLPPAPRAVDDDIKATVFDAIDGADKELRALNLAIHDNPELGFQEVKAHAHLVKTLTKLGFTVTNPSSLPTAFVATYSRGSGGRTFGFNAEFDALKDVGHACGHNLIATIAVAAAYGLAIALKRHNISGTVRLIGSPAEEGGGGKVILLNEGVYDGLDACVMAHPEGGFDAPGTEPEFAGQLQVGGPASLARAGFDVEFHGRGAHAGAAPWMGINALDAAVQGYTAVSMLRQQLEPSMRVHGVILGSEQWAQNIIPSYAKLSYSTRALTVAATLELRRKVLECFKAAAAATGCTIDVTALDTEVYAELRNNGPLADAYSAFMGDVFKQKIQREGMTTASTDFGNCCYAFPSIHPGFHIPAPYGSINHTAGFTAAARAPEAHAAAIKVAKGLAVLGAKFLTDDAFAKDVKHAWEKFRREVGKEADAVPGLRTPAARAAPHVDVAPQHAGHGDDGFEVL